MGSIGDDAMNSEQLNKKIREICDKDELSIEGGKCIPYIGWFWRDVDFDAETYSFGIIPTGTGDYFNSPSEAPYVGFMENNKWGYEYTKPLTKTEWVNVKNLLVIAVLNPNRETTGAVHDCIQKFGSEKNDA